jgi:Transposase, Mutator family
MSIAFSQGKLRGEQRKDVLQMVQQQIRLAALEAIRVVMMELLEVEVTTKLGREKGAPRKVGEAREIDWHCGNCGCRDANRFTRDGHYRRDLQTGWGHVRDLRVPMLECQNCHHDVICRFAVFEKNQRFWLDLDQDAILSSGLCQSLREISDRWGAILGGSVGLRTVNERINQIESLARAAHCQPIQDAPDVIQFDGIWMTIAGQNETVKYDTRNRARHERKGEQIVILVALGFWQHGERREVVDWQIAKSEGHEEWEVLLNRLYERGLTPENGLQAAIRDGGGGLEQAVDLVYGAAIVDQRCIFHKLKNVADACRKELKGNKHKEKRRELMQQASTVYEAESAEQAKENLTAWANVWRKSAPKSVATLERDFDATIAYFQLEGLAREWIRTTSLLERVNRQLRRKFRQALTFGSNVGAEVALYLQIQRLHAQWTNTSWSLTSRNLYLDLVCNNP